MTPVPANPDALEAAIFTSLIGLLVLAAIVVVSWRRKQ